MLQTAVGKPGVTPVRLASPPDIVLQCAAGGLDSLNRSHHRPLLCVDVSDMSVLAEQIRQPSDIHVLGLM